MVVEIEIVVEVGKKSVVVVRRMELLQVGVVREEASNRSVAEVAVMLALPLANLDLILTSPQALVV